MANPSGFIPDDQFVSDEDQYGGAAGEAKSLAAGAARGATFGLSDQAMVRSGLVNPDTLKGLKETNPISSIAGEFAGILLPAMAGDTAGLANLPAVASKIGRLTEAGIASAVPAGRLATTIARGIGFGAEGALYGVGNSISENALGNQDLVSEKTLGNIGYSAAMAGALGGVLGAYAGPALDESSGASKLAVENAAKGMDPESPEAAALSTSQPAEQKQTFLDALQSRKRNASDIQDAADELGVKAHPGQLSANKTVQDTYTALAETPTIPGVMLQNAVKKDFDAVQGTLKEALGAYEPQGTSYEVGAGIKEGLMNKVEDIYQPLKDEFERRAAVGDELPLEDDSRLKFYDDLVNKSKDYGSNGSKGSQIIRGYAERALTQNSGRQMDALVSEVGQAQRAAFVAQDHEAANALSVVKDDLREFLDKEITKNFKGEGAEEEINRFNETKKNYRDFKNTLTDLVSDQRIKGAKKNVTVSSLDEALSKIPNEQVVDKFFNPKNYDGLKRLQKNFPDIYESLISHKKTQVLEGTMTDGNLDINKVLKQIYDPKKMSDEVRSLIFDEKTLKKLDAAKTWMDAWPKHFNPSGTSYGQVLREGLQHLPTTVLNNVTSLLTKRALDTYAAKGEAGKLMAIGNVQRQAMKAEKTMDSQVKAIVNGLRAGAAALPSRFLNSDNFEDKTQKIREDAMNGSKFMDGLDQATSKFASHVPQISQSLQMALTRTNQFLAAKLPPQNQSLFGEKPKVSSQEISKFNRYYTIAEDPYHALTQVKQGTLTPETIETLNTVYPTLYNDMKERMVNGIMKSKDPSKIPYQTRLSINQFLGDTEDGMTTLASQMVNAQAQQPNQPQGGGQKVRAKGLDNLSGSDRMTADYGAMSDKV